MPLVRQPVIGPSSLMAIQWARRSSYPSPQTGGRIDHRPASFSRTPRRSDSSSLSAFGWWNLWLAAWPVASAVPDELDSIANAGRSHAPAIFLRATGDTLIPPTFQKRISNAYAGRVTILELKGANHDTPLSVDDQAAIAEAIEQFR